MENRRQQKRSREQKVMWRVTIYLVIFVMLILIFLPGHGILHYRKLLKQKDSIVRENERLEKKNRELTLEIEQLKSDNKVLEKIAREQHGLLKKNEEVYDFEK